MALKNYSIEQSWQGHSECWILKFDTQLVSQLLSSLQFKMHWPRVLLALFIQAFKLSSLEPFLNDERTCYHEYFLVINSHCNNKLGFRILDSHQCNPYGMDKLNILLLQKIAYKKTLKSICWKRNLPSEHWFIARPHSMTHSEELQFDTHCMYTSSHFAVHL